jgi:molybdopterin molybdotransferase
MLVPGACVRLFTGSPLPRGADAVVRQEATHLDPAQSEWVRVSAAVKTGDHVRRRGEDVRRGATLVARGVRLSAGQVSLLAAAGVSTVLVGRQPVVGLLATGNELCEPGQSLAPGQVYECNRLGLAAMIAECGGVPKTYPLVPDTEAATRAALQRAFAACDLVLTSGGVSVGKHDWVKPAFERLGGRLDFWQVAVKPGQPFVFGRWRGRLLLGLPGNPVSALVTFLLLARPALLRWQGAGETGLPEQPGWLAQAVANEGSRRHFLRVRVDGAGWIRLAGLQASHVLSGLGRANGLLAVPPHTRWPRGRRVRVLRWHG